MGISLKVLGACECSQRVTHEFLELGHDAYSCDLQDSYGEHPDRHLKGDCRDLLAIPWDIVIAHPPCTYLSHAQAQLYNRDRLGDAYVDDRIAKREQAITFFLQMYCYKTKHLAIENPCGYIGSHIVKADQYYEPWQYGEPYKKMTGLWLRGLPPLVPTKIVPASDIVKGYYENISGGKDRAILRSETTIGVAKAMAQQWSAYVIKTDYEGGYSHEASIQDR